MSHFETHPSTVQEVSISSENMLLLDRQLCFPLYAAAKEVVRRYTPFLAPFGLTYTQYIAMMVLWEQKTIGVSELGERLMLDSGTLTPLLHKLEDKGYLVREKSTKDGRRLIVSLTREGEALKHKMIVVPQEMGSCLRLSPAEVSELKRLLKKVTDSILESTEKDKGIKGSGKGAGKEVTKDMGTAADTVTSTDTTGAGTGTDMRKKEKPHG